MHLRFATLAIRRSRVLDKSCNSSFAGMELRNDTILGLQLVWTCLTHGYKTREAQSWNFNEFVWSTFLQFCFERGSLTCYLLLRIPLPIPCYLFARKGLSEFKSVMRGQPVILLLNHHSTNKKDIQAISIPGLGSSLPSSHHCNPQVVMSGIRRPWVRPMCCEPTWFH